MEEGTDISSWLRATGFPLPFKKAEAYKWYNEAFQVAKDNGISIEEARKLSPNPWRKPLSESDIQNIQERGDHLNDPRDWIQVEDPSHIAIHLTLDESINWEKIYHRLNLDEWTERFFGEGSSYGCFNDEPGLIWDICISWKKLQEMIR